MIIVKNDLEDVRQIVGSLDDLGAYATSLLLAYLSYKRSSGKPIARTAASGNNVPINHFGTGSKFAPINLVFELIFYGMIFQYVICGFNE